MLNIQTGRWSLLLYVGRVSTEECAEDFPRKFQKSGLETDKSTRSTC